MGWLVSKASLAGCIGTAWFLMGVAACGGTRADPAVSPATAEQTLADLFNLTALYQRMGRLAGGRPLPWVGQFASFAGRGDSTIVLLGLSLDNRALSFQRDGREFRARYRVEVMFQRAGALPIRHAREESVVVASFAETQRGDETIIYQQAFLLPPGQYQATVVVRDPGSLQFSRAEASLTVPALRPGTVGAPVLVYHHEPRYDLAQEPKILLNPRGTVAHGGDSLIVVVEAYGLPGVTRVPVVMRDERGEVLLRDELVFDGGWPVEQRTVRLAPDAPSLGRLNIVVGAPGVEKSTDALVSFSRSWVLTNYDNLLDLLRFFGHEDRLAELRRAAPGERPELWRRFWRETDPNPETPENEALERYFTRLAIANERFRDEAPQGWRTERGEVFITLGPPDQEIETPPGAGDSRIIQWAYNEYRTVLTFVGQYGFSRLRLTPASRAEFARLRALVRQRERAELEQRRPLSGPA
jgi:GWxTD domain-containing protein